MKIDKNGWFMRKYLGRVEGSWRVPLPDTVCDLTRLIAKRTFMWIFIALVVSFLTVSFFVGSFSWVMMFLGKWNAEFFNTNGFFGTSLVVSAFIWATGVLIAILTIHEYLNTSGKYRRAANLVNDTLNREPAAFREPSKLSQWVSAIYARVKDKTCVIIQYD